MLNRPWAPSPPRRGWGLGAAEGRGLLPLLATGTPRGALAPLVRGWSHPTPQHWALPPPHDLPPPPAVLPPCVLGPGFILGVEMETRKGKAGVRGEQAAAFGAMQHCVGDGGLGGGLPWKRAPSLTEEPVPCVAACLGTWDLLCHWHCRGSRRGCWDLCLNQGSGTGRAQGTRLAAQGSLHPQNGSFFFGNTRGVPNLHPGTVARQLGAPCARAPAGQRPRHLLCKSDTFIFLFFKSQLPNCSVLYSYGRAALSLPHYGTARPRLYKPQARSPAVVPPAPTRLLPASAGIAIAAAVPGVRVPSPPSAPVGAAPCREQAAWLLQVSISARHFPISTL